MHVLDLFLWGGVIVAALVAATIVGDLTAKLFIRATSEKDRADTPKR